MPIGRKFQYNSTILQLLLSKPMLYAILYYNYTNTSLQIPYIKNCNCITIIQLLIFFMQAKIVELWEL